MQPGTWHDCGSLAANTRARMPNDANRAHEELVYHNLVKIVGGLRNGKL